MKIRTVTSGPYEEMDLSSLGPIRRAFWVWFWRRHWARHPIEGLVGLTAKGDPIWRDLPDDEDAPPGP